MGLNDAHHASRPVGMRQHDGRLREQTWIFAQLRLRRLGHLTRQHAALTVQSLDLCGQHAGASGVILRLKKGKSRLVVGVELLGRSLYVELAEETVEVDE